MLCPDCPPAQAARDLVFADGFVFLQTALIAVLPFAAVFLAVWMIARGLNAGGRDD